MKSPVHTWVVINSVYLCMLAAGRACCCSAAVYCTGMLSCMELCSSLAFWCWLWRPGEVSLQHLWNSGLCLPELKEAWLKQSLSFLCWALPPFCSKLCSIHVEFSRGSCQVFLGRFCVHPCAELAVPPLTSLVSAFYLEIFCLLNILRGSWCWVVEVNSLHSNKLPHLCAGLVNPGCC